MSADNQAGWLWDNWIWTAIVAVITVAMLLSAMTRPGKIYEFPFLAAAITFAFILPQLPGLAADRFLPAGSYAKAIAFTGLCLAMCQIGWWACRRPMPILDWTFDERRLLIAAGVLSLIGASFYIQLSRLPRDVTVGTTISGLPVVYLFFSRMLTYGLALGLICLARRPSAVAWIIVLGGSLLYLDRIIITGKRGEAMEFLMLVALALWFHRGWAAPRFLMLTGLVAGTLLLGSTHDYRELTRSEGIPDVLSLSQIDIVENFEEILERGGPEMHNAVLRIAATDRSRDFDYGVFHWNMLVYTFVPAQVVGPVLKSALMIEMDQRYDREYDPLLGSTETGMADAFSSFWYFGALKFFLIAFTMRAIYRAAVAGSTGAEIVYLLSVVPAMHTLSHFTQWIVSAWVQLAIFLLPALLYARQRRDEVLRDNALPVRISDHQISMQPGLTPPLQIHS